MINETNIIHYGSIDSNCKIDLEDPDKYANNILELKGKKVGIIIFEKGKKVSADQHGYMRGGIIATTCMRTEKFAGWDEEDIYNYFADKFFFIPVVKTFGDTTVTFKKRLSMATCGKKRASKFIDDTIRYLASEGIDVPSPEEFLLGKYKTDEKTLTKLNSGESGNQEQNSKKDRARLRSLFEDC